MPLRGFGLISLFYVAIGIRFLFQFLPQRVAILDDDFTPYDRSMVSQAAFFIMLPISVLLHEAGHAVAILMFGGEIVESSTSEFSIETRIAIRCELNL